MSHRLRAAFAVPVLVSASLLAMPPHRLAEAAEACSVDKTRFRDVGPAYVDNKSGLLWRHCVAGQSIDMQTKRCQGAMVAIDGYKAAREYVENLGRRMVGIRMPTIDEVAGLADARCGMQAFGATPHAGYGGAPVWTTTPAGPGKVYQYDPAAGGKVAVDELDSPGVILLLIDPPKKSPDGKPR
jgi:hypothetical protein